MSVTYGQHDTQTQTFTMARWQIVAKSQRQQNKPNTKTTTKQKQNKTNKTDSFHVGADNVLDSNLSEIQYTLSYIADKIQTQKGSKECNFIISDTQDANFRGKSPSSSHKTIIGGSCQKYHFCLDKQLFVATKHVFLPRQKYACRDKRFVATNIFLSR